MKIIDQYPDPIRELVITDAEVRFLHDDCVATDASTGVFYRELAILLADRLKDLQ